MEYRREGLEEELEEGLVLMAASGAVSVTFATWDFQSFLGSEGDVDAGVAFAGFAGET